MGPEWPFEEPENTAVITLRQILREGAPILHVSHDADGEWQFLGWETPAVEDSLVVGLARIVAHDPSVASLHDLPPGWRAWRRSMDEAWTREKETD